MEYRDPPVFAVGIAFMFAPLAEKQWKESVRSLWNIYKDSFTHRDDVLWDNFQISSRSDQGVPISLKSETWLVQTDFRDENKQMFSMGRDRLIYYRFRNGQDNYPHFQIVLPKALEIFSRLVEIIPDIAIVQVAVTYLDDLCFPINENEAFNLSDYMLLGISIPETKNFGAVFDFNCRTSHALIGDDKGSFQIQILRVATEKQEYRIQAYWTCQMNVDDLHNENQELLVKKLDSAHQYCSHCFEDSLTSKAKALFNPNP